MLVSGRALEKYPRQLEETFLAGRDGFSWQVTWNFSRNTIHIHAWILQVSDEKILNTPTWVKSNFIFPQYGTQQIHGFLMVR